MSAIPYSIGNRLSASLQWPNKFYWSVFEILTTTNGLSMGLGNLEDFKIDNYSSDKKLTIKPETAYFVLKHIVYRTIQFDKPFEFIRRKDVKNGMPCNAIAKCSLSEASVKRVLNLFSPPYSDWLIKLKFRNNGSRVITPLYGLNLPGILELIDARWEAQIITDEVSKDNYETRPNKKPSNLMLRGRCLLQHCIEFSSHWKDAFQYLTKYSRQIEDLDRFIKKWSRNFPKPDDRTDLIKEFEYYVKECKKVQELRKEYLEALEE